MTHWISIDDAKPEEGQRIIVHDPWNQGSWYDTYINNHLASSPNMIFDKWKPCNHHKQNGECINQKSEEEHEV